MAQEKNIENLIKTYLEQRRIAGDKVFFFKQFQTGATKGGLPDIVCCWNGQFVGIETKALNGKISDEQVVIGSNIEKAGGLYILCNDANKLKAFYTAFQQSFPCGMEEGAQVSLLYDTLIVVTESTRKAGGINGNRTR